jgi:zinc/manganese transport system substrate-binding protein
VEVASLVGPDADAHSFEPSPADARRLKDARVIVVNGLGFEGWIDRLVRASGTKASVIVASRGVKPIGEKARHGHGHGHGHEHEVDPHAWQDVANAKLYVANIRDGLVKADPQGRAVYEANAARYLTRLDELDREVRAGDLGHSGGPARGDRHARCLRLFRPRLWADLHGAQGISTGKDPNAADIARIVRQIKARKIPAVFLENVSDKRLAERIAAESGAKMAESFIRTRSRRRAARPRRIRDDAGEPGGLPGGAGGVDPARRLQRDGTCIPECPALARRTLDLSHRGPVIRDLTVPEGEIALRPARLRRRRRLGRWLRRLYGTALIAWTLGLVAATSGLLHNAGARSNAVTPASPNPGDVVVPLPLPALPVWSERFREPAPR